MIGEVTLTEDELEPVIDKLQQGASKRRRCTSTCATSHRACGGCTTVATEIRSKQHRRCASALESTGTPLNESSEEESKNLDLDTNQLDQIIGQKDETEGGAYQFHVPRAETVTDTAANTSLSAEMEGGSLLMFQSTGGGKAAINGDFAMTDKEVNPVIQALRENGIEALPLHTSTCSTRNQPSTTCTSGRMTMRRNWRGGSELPSTRLTAPRKNKG